MNQSEYFGELSLNLRTNDIEGATIKKRRVRLFEEYPYRNE